MIAELARAARERIALLAGAGALTQVQYEELDVAYSLIEQLAHQIEAQQEAMVLLREANNLWDGR